jgi:hypothetical protein
MAGVKPLLIAAGAGLVLATAAQANVIRLNAADQKAARAVVLKISDVGSGFTGGVKKPDLSSDTGCKSYNPKTSDLVTTGAAETSWKQGIGLVAFDSQAEILKTAAMVHTDWARSNQPAVLTCLREQFKKQFGSQATLVSAAKVAVPQLATYTAEYRVVIDYQGLRIFVDVLLVGRGRTEITLTSSGLWSSHASVRATDLRLARLMVRRITA